MRRSHLAAFAIVTAATLSTATVPLRAEPPATDAATLQSAARVSGDPVRGRIVFGACRTCHYPDKGAGHQNGPSLWNIFGRQAGTQEGFAYYSEALKNSGLVWTPGYLDAWLANPQGFIQGTSMMSLGVPDPQQRADLIAYLMQFRDSP
jgi:cytochrome c